MNFIARQTLFADRNYRATGLGTWTRQTAE